MQGPEDRDGQFGPILSALLGMPCVSVATHVSVDGGTVNPVPYDLLLDSCDLVIGVDVIGQRTPLGM